MPEHYIVHCLEHRKYSINGIDDYDNDGGGDDFYDYVRRHFSTHKYRINLKIIKVYIFVCLIFN